jgi:hypothetical protein
VIPRYQRVLFWVLAGASLLMALVLLHGCEQAREKLTRHRNETPLAAPVAAPSQTVRLAPSAWSNAKSRCRMRRPRGRMRCWPG